MRWEGLLTAAIVAATASYGSVAAAAEPPTVDEVLSRLGYSDADKAAILGGQIISTDVSRSRDDQLIAAVALPIKTSVADLAAAVANGSNIPLSGSTLAWGEVTTGDVADFAGVGFDETEAEEVQKLGRFKGGSNFNMSEDEIALLQDAMKGLNSRDPAGAEAATNAYRQILAGRAQAYADKGLDGVASYKQGSSVLEPAEELRAVEGQIEGFLTEFFPDFWQALNGFPEGESPDISSKLYWVKRPVEDRPAFILIHQMVQSGDGYAFTSQRQFFV